MRSRGMDQVNAKPKHRQIILFLICSVACSAALYTVRHPLFNSFWFNFYVLLFECIAYALILKRMQGGNYYVWCATLLALGFAASAAAFAIVSILHDKYGISGFKKRWSELVLSSLAQTRSLSRCSLIAGCRCPYRRVCSVG